MAADLLKSGSRIEVQNGRNTLFWRDWWIGDFPLLDVATHKVSASDSFKLVKDYLKCNEGWMWEELHNVLPQQTLRKITPILLRNYPSSDDSLVCSPSPKGYFTVSSAYALAAGHVNQMPMDIWAKIWKLKVLQRVRMFMWTLCHGKILTNSLQENMHFPTKI